MRQWGDGFFFVNERGHVAVHPLRDQELSIDIADVVQDLRNRKVKFPVLLRFQDVLQARVVRLNTAFREAIEGAGYQNPY